jgi:hypothetical protein
LPPGFFRNFLPKRPSFCEKKYICGGCEKPGPLPAWLRPVGYTAQGACRRSWHGCRIARPWPGTGSEPVSCRRAGRERKINWSIIAF